MEANVRADARAAALDRANRLLWRETEQVKTFNTALQLSDVLALIGCVRDVMAQRAACVAQHNDLCCQAAAAEASIRAACAEGRTLPPAAAEELRQICAARDEALDRCAPP